MSDVLAGSVGVLGTGLVAGAGVLKIWAPGDAEPDVSYK
jgi:hypothetical protein